MPKKWNLWISVVPVVVLAGLLPGSAAADPVSTVTVTFVVGGADASRGALGAQVDPTFGDELGVGTFSFSSALIPAGGGALIRATGLPVESLAFSFAGTSWTLENAGVTDLRFAADRSLTAWALGGAPFGFTGLSIGVFPDMRVARPNVSTIVPQCCFSYTTAENANLGIFSGRLLSVHVTETSGGDPSPVPEPASLLLVGSGVAALLVRRQRRARVASAVR